jgi:hypothetical protein
MKGARGLYQKGEERNKEAAESHYHCESSRHTEAEIAIADTL